MSAHTCHWPDCKRPVPEAMWGCLQHWRRLPHVLRNKIWETYVPGQEVRKDPSEDYLVVALEIQEWCKGQQNA